MTKSRKLKAKSGSQSDRTETRDFRVAIAQFAPVYLDKAASVRKPEIGWSVEAAR